jgi:formimidoylglutamate deiminase
MITKYYRFNALLLRKGWLSPAYVGIDDVGIIRYLSDKAPEEAIAIEAVSGYALPGFQNAHSHAFQFAMAGMAEKHAPNTNDDFWSWRETMYRCALSIDPDEMEAIAAMLYAEMLKRGYTHVAEFHYLHHDKDGKPYSNLAEMGERLVAAAATAGIKITLIPVFYQQGGFGKETQPEQRRFLSRTVDDYFHLLDDSAHVVKDRKDVRLGFSVHSLRAVKAADVISTFTQGPPAIPFHLHAAEQRKEVEDCRTYLKQRPVEWILDHLPVNDRFHLVHCTHMDDVEIRRLAESGAHVVLCPGTEGNLGDGIFPLGKYAASKGHWSIGTDSHISLNPVEDLRWLDYTQRLSTHQRNTFDDGASVLVNKTFDSGRKAMGLPAGDFFEADAPFDAVIYDARMPLIMQAGLEHLLSAILYTSSPLEIFGTILNGRWVVKNHHHIHEGEIMKNFMRARKRV